MRRAHTQALYRTEARVHRPRAAPVRTPPPHIKRSIGCALVKNRVTRSVKAENPLGLSAALGISARRYNHHSNGERPYSQTC